MDDLIPIRYVKGRRAMKQLALSTVCALAEADLNDQIEELERRLFSLGADALCEVTLVRQNVSQWTFKPMVELLLHEVRDIALARLSAGERRSRIAWTLEAAGF